MVESRADGYSQLAFTQTAEVIYAFVPFFAASGPAGARFYVSASRCPNRYADLRGRDANQGKLFRYRRPNGHHFYWGCWVLYPYPGHNRKPEKKPQQ
jgi:hypothetical protein